MVSSRWGLVESSATEAPISSSIRRTYFTAAAGRSRKLRAPWVLEFQPSMTSYIGVMALWAFSPAGR